MDVDYRHGVHHTAEGHDLVAAPAARRFSTNRELSLRSRQLNLAPSDLLHCLANVLVSRIVLVLAFGAYIRGRFSSQVQNTRLAHSKAGTHSQYLQVEKRADVIKFVSALRQLTAHTLSVYTGRISGA